MSEQELKRRLRAHGFELARQRKHLIYKNPSGLTFVVPSTPSDQRWSHNALADLARLVGPVETDSRPLRARRQHGRLDPHRAAVAETRAAGEVQQAVEPPKPAPAAPLSRADRVRLKRWEKYERYRVEQDAKRLAKLSDLAHRAHESLEQMARRHGNHHPAVYIVGATQDAYRRVRQLGFKDVALSVAYVEGNATAVAMYVRVGGRFIDIFEGVVREGPTWDVEGGAATVEVWADMGPGDFDEFYETEMYLGPRYVTPSMLNIELKIPGGRTAELALFRALLSYEEGLPALIVLDDGAILHGGESLEAGATTPEGFKGNVFFLAGNDTDEIVRAFNEPDCDWPEMLEVGRQNFMERGKPPSKSYVAWLKHEIAKREDDETKAA